MDFFSIKHILVNISLGNVNYQLSYLEVVSAISGLLCMLFASFEKAINYLFGLINVTLFGIIFFHMQLYANLLLQIFFFIINIYGWYVWSRVKKNQNTKLKIRWLSFPQAVSISVVSSLVIIYITLNIETIFRILATWIIKILNIFGVQLIMPVLELDAFPFWDATMTVLSVVAMILMTRKYVENWILWVIINFISVILFYKQGFYILYVEYLILLGIALNGLRLWMKSA
ncbi:Nicotinamide riboside transporter PnuC [Candidatus Hartigia pinicola]|nr:Nicotinamide riboside transporter PnuC [Candidatus Hartigia pinicola]